MKAVELDKTYNPKDFEDRLYKFWEDKGYFKPAGDEKKDPFTIVIPPPNVSTHQILKYKYKYKLRPLLRVGMGK